MSCADLLTYTVFTLVKCDSTGFHKIEINWPIHINFQICTLSTTMEYAKCIKISENGNYLAYDSHKFEWLVVNTRNRYYRRRREKEMTNSGLACSLSKPNHKYVCHIYISHTSRETWLSSCTYISNSASKRSLSLSVPIPFYSTRLSPNIQHNKHS